MSSSDSDSDRFRNKQRRHHKSPSKQYHSRSNSPHHHRHYQSYHHHHPSTYYHNNNNNNNHNTHYQQRYQRVPKNAKLFLTNIDAIFSSEQVKMDLERIFGSFGTIKEIVVKTKQGSKNSYAFIQFDQLDDATKALQAMRSKIFKGKELKVQYGKGQKKIEDRQPEIQHRDRNRCYLCHRDGHYAKDCKERPRQYHNSSRHNRERMDSRRYYNHRYDSRSSSSSKSYHHKISRSRDKDYRNKDYYSRNRYPRQRSPYYRKYQSKNHRY